MGNSLMRPGFRFHPTDDELVTHYLKEKLLGNNPDPQVIAEVNINDFEPRELSAKSILSGDRKKYFFCPTLKKYSSGSRKNRATNNGYWKGTGKDKEVKHKGKTVAMRKTLIFYENHPENGTRTNWVMHEFRMTDEDLVKLGVDQEAYVVCKVFEKSGPGPKNGEQYGATFEEKEWDNEDGDDEGSTVTSTMMVGVLVNPNNLSGSSGVTITSSTEASPSSVTSSTVFGLSGAIKMLDLNSSSSSPSTLISWENEKLTVVPVNNTTQEVDDRKRKKVRTIPFNENDILNNDYVMLTHGDVASMLYNSDPQEVEDPKGKKVMVVPINEYEATFEDLMGLSNKDLGLDDFEMFTMDEFAYDRMTDDEFGNDRMNDDEFQKYMEMLRGLI